MLIVCPNCATSFTLTPTALGAEGRSVRCARCRTVWFASTQMVPDRPVASTAMAAAPEPQTASSFDAIWPAAGGAEPDAEMAASETPAIDASNTAAEPTDAISDAAMESAEHAAARGDENEGESAAAPPAP